MKYNNLPIFYKILLVFAIFIFFLLLLTTYNFFAYHNQAEREISKTMQSASDQATNELNNYVADLETITLLPLSKRYEGYDFSHILDEYDRTGALAPNIERAVKGYLQDTLNLKKGLQSAFLVTPSGKLVYSFFKGGRLDSFLPTEAKWFPTVMNSHGSSIAIEPYSYIYYHDQNKKDALVFGVSRAVISIPSGKPTGAIVLNTDVQYLSEIISRMRIYDGQRIVVVNKEGITVFDTKSENISLAVEPLLMQAITLGSEKIMLNGENTLTATSTVEKLGWTLINLVPAKTVSKGANTTVLFTMGSILAIIVLSYSSSAIVSMHIVKPIKNLIISMESVENENFDVEIVTDRTDEIGTLSTTFNGMIHRINQLINEVYVDKIVQKELELSMLQSQINPHFLYNTLEAISMAAELNNDVPASVMAAQLGKILRYSLNNEKSVVPLWEEMSILNEYISLQRERLDEQFIIEEEIDPKLYDQYIIRLTLQPILENAISHGMKDVKQHGIITITSETTRSTIILRVSDNGHGMPPQQVNELNAYINGKNNSFKGIGLKNVNKRLQLHFGDEYGIAISSMLGMGTTASIYLPFHND